MARRRRRKKESSRTRAILESVGHELKTHPPAIVRKTARTEGPAQAERQRVAILLSKARRGGANIPTKGGAMAKKRRHKIGRKRASRRLSHGPKRARRRSSRKRERVIM